MHLAAQPLQQGSKHGDIEIAGHVAQGDEMRREQRRHHQRQGGILGAADRIAADERIAAPDVSSRPVPGRHQGTAVEKEAFMGETITEAALTALPCAAYRMSMITNLLQKGWYFTLLK